MREKKRNFSKNTVNNNTEKILKEKTKKLSIIEGSFFSVHEGFGIKYITPFALSIGKNNPHINAFVGILNSLPNLIGNLSQLYTSKVMGYKRRKVISWGIILQSLMWLGVIFSGFMFFLLNWNSNISLLGLVIFYTLLVLFGTFVGPVWVSLMRDIVTDDRGEYFARRNRIAGLIALLSSLIAGIILDYFGKSKIFIGFFILFFAAFIFRTISGVLLLHHFEPKFKQVKSKYFSFLDFLRGFPKSNFLMFSIFISFFMFATYIAGPFFTVYMLNNLGFSYLKWTIITIIGSLSSLLFMPFWGKFVDKYGSIKTIKITGIFIPLIPFIWLLTYFFEPSSLSIVVFLIGLEFFAGMLWAGFTLSYSNFIYDAVSREKTHLCSAYFNILHAIGIFLGASLGGIILSISPNLFGISALFFVFILSGIMRFLGYIIITPKINEVRDIKTITIKDMKNIIINNTFHKFRKLHIKPFSDIFEHR